MFDLSVRLCLRATHRGAQRLERGSVPACCRLCSATDCACCAALAGRFRRDALFLGYLRRFFRAFLFFLRGLFARDSAFFAFYGVVLLFDRFRARDVGAFLFFQCFVARG